MPGSTSWRRNLHKVEWRVVYKLSVVRRYSRVSTHSRLSTVKSEYFQPLWQLISATTYWYGIVVNLISRCLLNDSLHNEYHFSTRSVVCACKSEDFGYSRTWLLVDKQGITRQGLRQFGS